MNKTDLSKYQNPEYKPGGGTIKRLAWYFTNAVFLRNPLNPFSGVKVFLLKLFGAKIGKGVVIKPAVNIKYPWRLSIGNYSWLGENVWIDNLEDVAIADNCCLSQGAMLLTGNHNYKKTTFDLMTKGIILESGVWIGAYSIVAPGVCCKSHSVLAVNSVAVADLASYSIYQGNPAKKVRDRQIE